VTRRSGLLDTLECLGPQQHQVHCRQHWLRHALLQAEHTELPFGAIEPDAFDEEVDAQCLLLALLRGIDSPGSEGRCCWPKGAAAIGSA